MSASAALKPSAETVRGDPTKPFRAVLEFPDKRKIEKFCLKKFWGIIPEEGPEEYTEEKRQLEEWLEGYYSLYSTIYFPVPRSSAYVFDFSVDWGDGSPLFFWKK